MPQHTVAERKKKRKVRQNIPLLDTAGAPLGPPAGVSNIPPIFSPEGNALQPPVAQAQQQVLASPQAGTLTQATVREPDANLNPRVRTADEQFADLTPEQKDQVNSSIIRNNRLARHTVEATQAQPEVPPTNAENIDAILRGRAQRVIDAGGGLFKHGVIPGRTTGTETAASLGRAALAEPEATNKAILAKGIGQRDEKGGDIALQNSRKRSALRRGAIVGLPEGETADISDVLFQRTRERKRASQETGGSIRRLRQQDFQREIIRGQLAGQQALAGQAERIAQIKARSAVNAALGRSDNPAIQGAVAQAAGLIPPSAGAGPTTEEGQQRVINTRRALRNAEIQRGAQLSQEEQIITASIADLTSKINDIGITDIARPNVIKILERDIGNIVTQIERLPEGKERDDLIDSWIGTLDESVSGPNIIGFPTAIPGGVLRDKIGEAIRERLKSLKTKKIDSLGRKNR